MTIRIELNPEMEEKIASAAHARGMALESYARELLQEALSRRTGLQDRINAAEFRDRLDALAAGSRPAPSSETFSRSMIYDERD